MAYDFFIIYKKGVDTKAADARQFDEDSIINEEPIKFSLLPLSAVIPDWFNAIKEEY